MSWSLQSCNQTLIDEALIIFIEWKSLDLVLQSYRLTVLCDVEGNGNFKECVHGLYARHMLYVL